MTTRTYNLVGDNQVAINITQLIIAAGVTVACFASFALLRSSFFHPQLAAQDLSGIHERLKKSEPAQDQGWEVPTPLPTIAVPADQAEYPVPLTNDPNDQAIDQLKQLWLARGGNKPEESGIPGCLKNLSTGETRCWDGHQLQNYSQDTQPSANNDAIDTQAFNSYLQSRSKFQQGGIGLHQGNWGINGYTTTSGMRAKR